MQRFDGRVAVVTGGASGLGAAMAGAFAAEGMRVLLADIDADGAARVAKELECDHLLEEIEAEIEVL